MPIHLAFVALPTAETRHLSSGEPEACAVQFSVCGGGVGGWG